MTDAGIVSDEAFVQHHQFSDHGRLALTLERFRAANSDRALAQQHKFVDCTGLPPMVVAYGRAVGLAATRFLKGWFWLRHASGCLTPKVRPARTHTVG